MHRPWVVGAVVATVLFAAHAPRSRADASVEDTWAAASSPSLSRAEAAANLSAWAATLSAVEDGSWTVSAVTVLDRDRTAAKALATRLDAARDAAKGALRAAGFATRDLEPWVVVHVLARDADPLVVTAPDGATFLVRERTGTSSPPAPPALARADGPPIARDAREAADRARDHAATAAAIASAQAGALTVAVARAAIAATDLPETTPAWLREALVVWTARKAGGETAPTGVHVCGCGKGAPPSAARLMDPASTPSSTESLLLGLVVADALGDSADAAARVAAIASSPDRGPAAFGAAFARPAADLVAAAWARAGAASEAPSCDAARTVPCTVCRATGKVEVACTACAALARAPCASCGGEQYCPAPMCIDGAHPSGDVAYVCKFCSGIGWTHCRACKSEGAFPCKGCAGRGRTTWPCPACAGSRRVPCARGGESERLAAWLDPKAPCPACAATVVGPCRTCGGTAVSGCATCRGIGRVPCPHCDGVACDRCSRGGRDCPACVGVPGAPCKTCAGKGTAPMSPAGCWLCGGSGTARGLDVARAAIAPPGDRAAEIRANVDALRKAVDFLLTCRDKRSGEFALRRFRRSREDSAGALGKPSLYSNAEVVWTLVAAGIGSKDEKLAPAVAAVRELAQELVDEKKVDVTTQSVAVALRALAAAAEDPSGPLVRGLVQRLVKAQRANGLWAETVLGKDPGDAFQSIFAIEALAIARRRGAKVPSEVWSRALSAAQSTLSAQSRDRRKKGWTSATDVASGVTLVAIAKAGTLGDKAGSLEEYKALPAVREGLAWLDRHFDVEHQTSVARGTVVRSRTDSGYSAFLYAVERMGSLLSIPVIAGRRWYVEGARSLRAQQLPDGSFEELGPGRLNGPVRTTCSAMLFLLRATPPITSGAGAAATAPADEGD
jgi:hypothetical protein